MLGNESLREAFAIGPPSAEVAREYLHWLRHTRRRTALTVYQYAGKLESFLAWIDHDSLSNVDATTVEAWLDRPRGGRGGKPGAEASLAKEASLLRGLYRFGLARGMVDRDPTTLVYTPAPKNENPRPVPDEAWIQLWSV